MGKKANMNAKREQAAVLGQVLVQLARDRTGATTHNEVLAAIAHQEWTDHEKRCARAAAEATP